MCLTGRTWGASEAKAFGFIQGDLFDSYAQLKGSISSALSVLEAGENLAGILASKSQTAVENTKRSILDSYEHPSIKQGLQKIALVNSSALQSEELPRNVSNFLSKSKL